MLEYFGVIVIFQPALTLVTVSGGMMLAGILSLAIDLYKKSNGSSFKFKYTLLIALGLIIIEIIIVQLIFGVHVVSFESIKGLSHTIEN